jgi:hypothetical protein
MTTLLQVLKNLPSALLSNLGAALFIYIGMRLCLNWRTGWRKTWPRWVLSFLCLAFGLSISSLLGNALVNNYQVALLNNIAPTLIIYLSVLLAIDHGAINLPTLQWEKKENKLREISHIEKAS